MLMMMMMVVDGGDDDSFERMEGARGRSISPNVTCSAFPSLAERT